MEGRRGIPIIDLEDFPVQIGKLMVEASEEWGCFRVINHKIPSTLMSEMKKVVTSLFDLPMDIKRRNTDVFPNSGYRAPSSYVDNSLYESMGMYDMASSQGVTTFCAQLDASPHQREIIDKYVKAVHELAMDLAHKLAQTMGFKGYIEFQGWHSICRLMKYHFSPESVGSIGAPLHTDSGFMTILQDDEYVGGLEILDKSGESVPVDPLPGAFLVNLGDIAMAWSNGRLYNVKHRVACKQAATRVSIASFILGPKDGFVKTPAEFVDSQHPPLYSPFTYDDYVNTRQSKSIRDGEEAKMEETRGIPIIDLEDFPVQIGKRIIEASEEWGCFRIINHKVPSTLMSEMKKVVTSLFDFPIDIKRRNTDVFPSSGYRAPSSYGASPLYESLGLYDMASSQGVTTFCDQLDASPLQKEIIDKYVKAVHDLAMDLAQKLAQSMGFKSDIEFEGWSSICRMIKYHFSPESVGSIGARLHTDASFMTILQDDENVGGLEVVDKSGEFVPVHPLPGAFLINLGDIAMAWSNGRLYNVKHRVACKEAANRVCIASFILGPKEGFVKAPAEFVDCQHLPLYSPFTYDDYVKIRESQNIRDGEVLLQLLRSHS
ncbi:hypothetical protein ACOSQ2_006540 [Xanthoceras sorbifolium]